MEVKNARSGMLTNFEVLKILGEVKIGQERGGRNREKLRGLSTVVYEAKQYLESTPCSQQNPAVIEQLVSGLSPFKLTKAETLQVVNSRPTSAVQVALILEEVEERLSEQQVEQLIQVVVGALPSPSPSSKASAKGDDDEDEEDEDVDVDNDLDEQQPNDEQTTTQVKSEGKI